MSADSSPLPPKPSPLDQHNGTNQLSTTHSLDYTPPNLPARGLSVRRSIIHERSSYGFSLSPPPPGDGNSPSQQAQGLLEQQTRHRQPAKPRLSVGPGKLRPQWAVYFSVPSGDQEGEDQFTGRQQQQRQGVNSRRRKRMDSGSSRIGGSRPSGSEPPVHSEYHPHSLFGNSQEQQQGQEYQQAYDDPRNQNPTHIHTYPETHADYWNRQSSQHYQDPDDEYSPSGSSRAFAAQGAPFEGVVTSDLNERHVHQLPPQGVLEGGVGAIRPHGENTGYYGQERSVEAGNVSTSNLPHHPLSPHFRGQLARQSNSSLRSNRVPIPPVTAIGNSSYNRLSQMGGSATALGIDGQIDVDLLDDATAQEGDDDGLDVPPSSHSRGGLGGSTNSSGVLFGAGALGGAAAGAGVGNGTRPGSNGGSGGEKPAESEWLQQQRHSKKKTRIIAIVVAIMVIIAIAGGVTAGVLLSKKGSSSSSKTSSSDSSGDGGDSGGSGGSGGSGDINDGSWKDYLNNPGFHKVFYGMDYTPLDALYPECLTKPPTQAQINIDIAIMSQLTSRIRLYGTDCNQADMVLEAIKTTGVDMKIWLGIWLDTNATTNARSLSDMYRILKAYPEDMFEGVAVGNEILFRQDMTEAALTMVLQEVKTNFTELGYKFPIGTSDLGSKWTSTLASAVDVVMANVHPFFAGVNASYAATWTMQYYEENDLSVAKVARTSSMISEVGWPTGGGHYQGSVAGIDELNLMMKNFVCQRLSDGTAYFWFEAFDEPWKVMYNTPGEEWEDKWGLLSSDRKLKDGVEIPSCS